MIIAFYPGGGGNRYLQRLLGNNWAQPHKSYDQNNTGQKYEHRYLFDNIPQPGSQHILTHCMNSNRIQQVFPGQPIVFIKSNLQASLRREWTLHGHQRYLSQLKKHTVSRLEHYLAFRAPHWPCVDTEDQFDQLSDKIKQEVCADYDKVVSETIVPVPGVLEQLTLDAINKINSAYEAIKWHQDYYTQYPQDFSGAQQVIDIDTDSDEFSLTMRAELNRYPSEIFDQVWNTIYEQ